MLKSLISGQPVFTADKVAPDRKKTVCITGHREKSVPSYGGNPLYRSITLAAVKLMLYRYIDMAVERGYLNFISGLAVGTDLWAAEYIVKKRKSNENIRLIGAMPYLRHAERFPPDYRRLLAEVEKESDLLVTVNGDPDIVYGLPSGGGKRSTELYRERNYFMVDNSSAVIAFLSSGHSISGTAQTVNYANRSGCRVCRFGIDDVFRIIGSSGTDIRLIGREIMFLDNVFDAPF